jgi:hypothetical protein
MAQGERIAGGKDRRRHHSLSQLHGSTGAQEKTGGAGVGNGSKLLKRMGKRIFEREVIGTGGEDRRRY